jgi:cutinase-like protein
MKLRSMSPPPQSVRGLCAAGLLAAALVVAPAFARTGPTLIPTASAACPDAEVVFARGRLESPGAGVLGNAFTSALRSRVNKNVSLYAVRYPADTEVDVGANDMSAHVQSTINGCPNTRIVLGGYSLGAAVTDVVMAAPGPMFGFTNPLPPGATRPIRTPGRTTGRNTWPMAISRTARSIRPPTSSPASWRSQARH